MGLVLCVIGWIIGAICLGLFILRDSWSLEDVNKTPRRLDSAAKNPTANVPDMRTKIIGQPLTQQPGPNRIFTSRGAAAGSGAGSGAEARKRRSTKGRRRAVVFGLNYLGKDYELFGCISDALSMQKLLLGPYEYDEVLLMTDNTPSKPTRANMIKALDWLVKDVTHNDSLTVHYSGHGDLHRSRQPGAKRTDVDDTIVPLDWEQAGQITDDQLKDLLVRPLQNVRACLTVIFDCCHSGTGLDLKFNYRIERNRVSQMADDPRPPLQSDVVLYSACLDSQTADDTTDSRGASYGAFTNSLLNVLQRANYNLSYGALLLQMQNQLRIVSTQDLQLSSEKKLNLDAPFGFGCANSGRAL